MTDDTVRLPSARRISFQPVMAIGLTGSELIAVIASGFLGLFAIVLITITLSGALHISLLSGALLGFAGAFMLRSRILLIKRQAPEGYVQQRFLELRAQFTNLPGQIERNAGWDTWRHHQDG